MDQLTLGVMSQSAKENEHRRPIHPQHLDRIDPGLRSRIFLEHGYGERFGVTDDQLAASVGGIRTRERAARRVRRHPAAQAAARRPGRHA